MPPKAALSRSYSQEGFGAQLQDKGLAEGKKVLACAQLATRHGELSANSCWVGLLLKLLILNPRGEVGIPEVSHYYLCQQSEYRWVSNAFFKM